MAKHATHGVRSRGLRELNYFTNESLITFYNLTIEVVLGRSAVRFPSGHQLVVYALLRYVIRSSKPKKKKKIDHYRST